MFGRLEKPLFTSSAKIHWNIFTKSWRKTHKFYRFFVVDCVVTCVFMFLSRQSLLKQLFLVFILLNFPRLYFPKATITSELQQRSLSPLFLPKSPFISIRKCTSHTWNNIFSIYLSEFIKLTIGINDSRKATTACPRTSSFGGVLLLHWNEQDLLLTLTDPDKSSVPPLDENITFVWNKHFFQSLLSYIYVFSHSSLLFFVFWIRS